MDSSTPSHFDYSDSSPSQPLILRIRSSVVVCYTKHPAVLNAALDAFQTSGSVALDPDVPPFIPVLHRPVAEFCHFSRDENSKWLIDIAHDIFDPQQKRGQLYRLDPSTPGYPDRVQDPQDTPGSWVQVQRSDALQPTLYEYVVSDSTIVLAAGDRFINSHIIPKRLGDAVAAHLVVQFRDPGEEPTDLNLPKNVADPAYGITIMKQLDTYFADFRLGLRRKTNEAQGYECHFFPRTEEGLDIHLDLTINDIATSAQLAQRSSPTAQLAHGQRITPPNHHTIYSNPLPATLRWHYMQCVIKKFGTEEYRRMRNIRHYRLPHPQDDDDDESWSLEDIDPDNPPWPNAIVDLGRYHLHTLQEEEAARRRVENLGCHHFLACFVIVVSAGTQGKDMM
ncbi:hypothetical protein VNI00_016922 [Paramarasmius palmivorus]|uniref:Uncharacterized protein n=1 Tax=Paramarasmius palmivorus TaxID=297713 RepID=A0AAW0B9E3_9AGAR